MRAVTCPAHQWTGAAEADLAAKIVGELRDCTATWHLFIVQSVEYLPCVLGNDEGNGSDARDESNSIQRHCDDT